MMVKMLSVVGEVFMIVVVVVVVGIGFGFV